MPLRGHGLDPAEHLEVLAGRRAGLRDDLGELAHRERRRAERLHDPEPARITEAFEDLLRALLHRARQELGFGCGDGAGLDRLDGAVRIYHWRPATSRSG